MTDIAVLNSKLRKARLKYEEELRAAVEEGSAIIAEAEGITDPDVITAAAGDHLTPKQRVAENITRIVLRGQKRVSLAAARGLATQRAQGWYELHEARLTAQAERAGQEAASTIEGFVKQRKVTKLAKDGRDTYSLARSIESVGAGGPPTVNASARATGAKPLTVMDDEAFRAMIVEEGEAEPLYRWEHGAPAQPFGPHEELDGTEWTADQELEVLENPNDFPSSVSYFPGDHDGCTCRYDVEFTRIS